jgi:hypothetical protein
MRLAHCTKVMQLRCRRNVNRITSQFLNIEREIRRDLVGGRTSTGELRAIQGKLADTYLVPYYIDHESTSAQTKQRKGNLRIFSFTYLAGDADLLRALRHLDWLRGAGLDSDSRGCWADDDDFDSCAAYFFFLVCEQGTGCKLIGLAEPFSRRTLGWWQAAGRQRQSWKVGWTPSHQAKLLDGWGSRSSGVYQSPAGHHSPFSLTYSSIDPRRGMAARLCKHWRS